MCRVPPTELLHMPSIRKSACCALLLCLHAWCSAQQTAPAAHVLSPATGGGWQGVGTDGQPIKLYRKPPTYTQAAVTPRAEGAAEGLWLRFEAKGLRKGRLSYGLIPYGQHTYPTAVLRFDAAIDSTGAAFLPIALHLRDGYDHTGWQQRNFGVIGYRLTDAQGRMVHEGKQAFARTAQGIAPRPTILRGPFVSELRAEAAVIWYESSEPVFTQIKTDAAADTFFSKTRLTRHEVTLRGLQPDHPYTYGVGCDSLWARFQFRTAPAEGSARPFTFAYASDSRSGYGGGERNMYGTNAQVMARIGALAHRENAAFVQFTGDLADGYVSEPDELRLQLNNWMHAVEPFWHYMPFNVGMGNHESLGWHADAPKGIVADGFPYETHSGEALFAEMFVNPLNGPQSEDGTRYDPNPYRRGDFPSYWENVYHYRHGNTAMVVLNSDYWYAPLLKQTRPLGGNLHGYLMDAQMQWLEATLAQFEADSSIAHVFVTLHTPPFPNGGHRGDCMWYDGDNSHRPWVAGKPVEKGIIERRDELLDHCANRSSKVVGFLCGDEHNYNRMLIEEGTPRYPKGWDKPRLALRRPLWQFINGAAGAPFYAQQNLPWSAAVRGFTVQNALCFFDVNGPKISLRVVNPDTLEEIDRVQLK
jgi:3',5'-cyclic AMP phosphodiesterase CpdA